MSLGMAANFSLPPPPHTTSTPAATSTSRSVPRSPTYKTSSSSSAMSALWEPLPATSSTAMPPGSFSTPLRGGAIKVDPPPPSWTPRARARTDYRCRGRRPRTQTSKNPASAAVATWALLGWGGRSRPGRGSQCPQRYRGYPHRRQGTRPRLVVESPP